MNEAASLHERCAGTGATLVDLEERPFSLLGEDWDALVPEVLEA